MGYFSNLDLNRTVGEAAEDRRLDLIDCTCDQLVDQAMICRACLIVEGKE